MNPKETAMTSKRTSRFPQRRIRRQPAPVAGRRSSLSSGLATGVGLAVLAPLYLPSALAAVIGTWADSTTAAGNWSDTSKWVAGIVPDGPGDTGNFDVNYGTNNKVITINVTSRTLGTLNIGDPGTTFRSVTIQAGSGLSLVFDNDGSGALLSKTTTANNMTDTITAPVVLADDLTVNMTDTTANSFLRVSGVISESGDPRSITKNGNGILQLGPIDSSAGPTNTYSGGFTLNAGEVQISTSAAFGSGTLTINGGTLVARGTHRTPPNPVVVGGDFTLHGSNAGNNLLTLAGSVDLGGATRIITVDAPGGAAISGVISNGGLTKAGIRTLTLAGNNTYTGLTSVNQGILTNATLNVSVAGTASEPVYLLASYGSLTGTFGTTAGIPAGYQLVYNHNDGNSPNNIALVAFIDPYLAWLDAYSAITGPDRAPDADFDSAPAADDVTVTIPMGQDLKKFVRISVSIPFTP